MCGVEVLVEVGVPGGRVHRVVLVVLGDVLRRRLGQQPENGLSLGQDLQDRLTTRGRRSGLAGKPRAGWYRGGHHGDIRAASRG